MNDVARVLLKIARELTSGVPVPPPAMVNAVYNWAVPHIAAKRLAYEIDYIKYLQSDPTGTGVDSDGFLKKSLVKAKKLKKLARGGNAKWRQLKKSFPVNLRGWKYEDMVPSIPKELDVVMRDSLGTPSWSPSTGVLKLTVGMTNIDNLWELRSTIEHELLHWAQTDLISGEFGVPSRKMRDEGVMQWVKHKGLSDKETHSLDDLEFYPMVKSKVDEFKHQDKDAREYIEAEPFFRHLKKRNRRKWEKAVNEFLKLVT